MGGMKTKPKVAAEIVLHHNPKTRTSDTPAAGQTRGKTMLPMDRTHPAGYQSGPSHSMGKC
jgi:hypothetical protein